MMLNPEDELNDDEKELIKLSMWASEPIPFDPMEIALHQAYNDIIPKDERPNYKLIHEYPLGGQPPMMTHIFEDNNGNSVIAAKGAPEALINVTNLTEPEKQQIHSAIQLLANDGYRVLGVGVSNFTGNNYPANQQDLPFQFKGIVAFYDPPKKNIQEVLDHFYAAGIGLKIITGDNAATTAAIAKQIGFKGYEKTITGDDLLEDDLSKMVDAIAMGRKIYTNLKKAIQYIISIHIPIILTVFIPLALGWIYPNIFSPIHIIFLEIIMGPTCSIIYENEPMEKNTMLQKPKALTTTFFNWKELSISIIQGLMISTSRGHAEVL